MGRLSRQARMRRLFTEGFAAIEITEPLYSVAGVREARVASISSASGAMASWSAMPGARIPAAAPVSIISSRSTTTRFCRKAGISRMRTGLEKHPYCLVAMLGHVGAYVSMREVHKPPLRMWLCGMITILETCITRIIREKYPDDSRQQMVSPGRLQKARSLFEERQRRKERVELVDCLQFGETGRILLTDDRIGGTPVWLWPRGQTTPQGDRVAAQQSRSLEAIAGFSCTVIAGLSRRLATIMTRICRAQLLSPC